MQQPGPRLVGVVAMARNGVIGRDGDLPWRLPDDLRRFKAITMGKPILMGRRTFMSLGRPLPGRENIVLTRDRAWTAEGVRVVHSLDEALAAAGEAADLMVIGGAEIYALAWPRIERLELTEVHADVEGDTRLDALDPGAWREVAREHHPADERHPLAFSFVTLERRGA
ncbi:MAG: dihydrofolate reductase [Steroidobacteraceae bacterium]|nr:dihydrofolate reductase [Steroidobacteraceae bacterium]